MFFHHLYYILYAALDTTETAAALSSPCGVRVKARLILRAPTIVVQCLNNIILNLVIISGALRISQNGKKNLQLDVERTRTSDPEGM